MIRIADTNVDLVLLLALILILSGVAYGIMMFVLSRFNPKDEQHHQTAGLAPVPAERDVVFVIPCLNEERVIGASLERLASLDHDKLHILVIDDGSNDATADIVLQHVGQRVKLLQRTAPMHGRARAKR